MDPAHRSIAPAPPSPDRLCEPLGIPERLLGPPGSPVAAQRRTGLPGTSAGAPGGEQRDLQTRPSCRSILLIATLTERCPGISSARSLDDRKKPLQGPASRRGVHSDPAGARWGPSLSEAGDIRSPTSTKPLQTRRGVCRGFVDRRSRGIRRSGSHGSRRRHRRQGPRPARTPRPSRHRGDQRPPP